MRSIFVDKQVAEWLKLSRRDLLGADFNLGGSDELLPFVGFLAQQAVEKVLKGFLTNHKKKFTKTHNLAHLLDRVRQIDGVLAESISKADDLTDFAVKYRYPEAIVKELTRHDVEEAVNLAKSVCAQVLEV